jgi:hypothetical protein
MKSWKCVGGLAALAASGLFACGSSNDDATGCSGLSACCAMLSGTESQLCQADVEMSGATDAACTQALMSLQNAGYCGSLGGTGGTGDGDAGGGGGGGDGAGGCAALSACCPNLPVSQNPMACLTVAMEGTAEACAESLATYEGAGYCSSGGSGPGGCKNPTAQLAACWTCETTSCSAQVSDIFAACSETPSCFAACDCDDTTCLSACLGTNEPTTCSAAESNAATCVEAQCKTACAFTAAADAGS